MQKKHSNVFNEECDPAVSHFAIGITDRKSVFDVTAGCSESLSLYLITFFLVSFCSLADFFIEPFPQMCFKGNWLQHRLQADENEWRSLLAVDI